MQRNENGYPSTFTFPVKGFHLIENPYHGDKVTKARFLVEVHDIPEGLSCWMGTNPREQNLGSSVAKAIQGSLQQDSHDFHMKNRGCLFSASEVSFTPQDGVKDAGEVFMRFDSPTLHGNIDGGHTLKLILAARAEIDLPEQYVEFEIIVGTESILDIAEARNTSVALDMRTLEGMKGSYDVLREVLGDLQLPGGDRFFDRVEMKMNEQQDEKNSIDIRQLISILLMFNQSLYPTTNEDGRLHMMLDHPCQMYGGKEAALKKYLELGGGGDGRDQELRAMAPVLPGIIRLWDIIERQLPLVNSRKYSKYPFASSRKEPRALFTNEPLLYHVPQSILFPIVAAFRCLISVAEDGQYCWRDDPIEIWEECRDSLFSTLDGYMKQYRAISSYTANVRKPFMWRTYYYTILMEASERQSRRQHSGQ